MGTKTETETKKKIESVDINERIAFHKEYVGLLTEQIAILEQLIQRNTSLLNHSNCDTCHLQLSIVEDKKTVFLLKKEIGQKNYAIAKMLEYAIVNK